MLGMNDVSESVEGAPTNIRREVGMMRHFDSEPLQSQQQLTKAG